MLRAAGLRLSEPTFRKYVQLGLLPRSRRVGRKGKHQGSVGVYPAAVVRRINLVKAMMSEGLTLQDIRRSFLFFKNEIDALERVLEDLFRGFERELDARLSPPARDEVGSELRGARAQARALVRRIERIGSRLAGAAPLEPAGREAQLTVIGEAPTSAGWSLRPAAKREMEGRAVQRLPPEGVEQTGARGRAARGGAGRGERSPRAERSEGKETEARGGQRGNR